jgi:hypothetical protein
MALVQSDQKGLDEIQRIRAAMTDGRPVLTEAQRELIQRHTALLGEMGKPLSRTSREKPRQRGASQRTSSGF